MSTLMVSDAFFCLHRLGTRNMREDAWKIHFWAGFFIGGSIVGILFAMVSIAKADTPRTYICESPRYSAIYGKKNCGKAAAQRAMRSSIRRNYQAEIGGKIGRREAAKAIKTYECRERV